MELISRIHGDHFDRLPDSLVLVIFDKVADARSLVRCSAVCKRFSGLVPLVHDVFLKIDWPVAVEDGLVLEELNLPSPDNTSSMFTLLKLMSLAAIRSYLYFLNANYKTLSARQALRKFTHVRNLKIELPPSSPGGGGLVTRDGQVLKWRAEFGSTLQTCMIVAATGMEEYKPAGTSINQVMGDIHGSIPETLFTDFEQGEKERSVTAVEFLTCATMRHYHLLPIIMDHPTLRRVVFTDADGLGTLVMGAEQLKDCRENPPQVVPSLGFPLCKWKSACVDWEPGEGRGRQKAAIMVIKPFVEGDATTIKEEVQELLVSGALEGPFVHVAKVLLLKQSVASQKTTR